MPRLSAAKASNTPGTTEGQPSGRLQPPRAKFRLPDRWEDHDYDRGRLIGARPVWEMAGQTYAGPRLVPEVIEPSNLADTKRGQAVLFDLWNHARLASEGQPCEGHSHGIDEKGRHRVT